MRTRLLRLRFRRRIRTGQQQAADLGTQAEQHIDRHLLRRFERLLPVRRFVIGWLCLLLLLIGAVVAQNLTLSTYYQTLRPVPGGIYNEGVKGRFTNANPLFASSDADLTVSRLVFAGLLTYDLHGNLIGDLASDYKVDEHGSTYTVHLKPHLKWQDGRPLTSADVLFTYRTIQNPDVRSSLQNAWQGIEVSAPDNLTIVFKLPGVLAAFPHNLTNGIVPEHLLANIPPGNLRSAEFNTVKPVGAGPFAWQALKAQGDGDPKHSQERIALIPFDGYQAGKPKLQEFVVQVFADESQMTQAFADKQLTAAEGLPEVPRELEHKGGVQQHNLRLAAANMVFFKTSEGVLADQKVRRSLVQAANVPQIAAKLSYPARLVREPILAGQVAYDPTLTQPGFNLAAAKAQLDSDGWPTGKNGTRGKDGRELAITLTAANTPEYRLVAGQLKDQWQKLGVKLDTQFLSAAEFQNALLSHNYEAILNGISIGADPDVFVYWDSSQADIRSVNRLNFSEYKNPAADASLEAGRTRLDPSLRAIKYRPFLEAWQQDSPALGLYQPRLLYLTNGTVAGLTDEQLPTTTDRFINVQNWEIHQAKVTN